MAKKDEQKLIRIACEAADVVELDDFIPLQGDLKILSEDGYQRCRLSIIEHGFSFSVQAWKDKKTIYILDAHQRLATCRRMRDEEGYVVPPLPTTWVKAASKQEAARKLLAAASQYGEVTADGLFSFMSEFNVDLNRMQSQFKFPEIDMTKFQQAYFPEEREVSFKSKVGSKELDRGDFDKPDHTCPKCSHSWNDR